MKDTLLITATIPEAKGLLRLPALSRHSGFRKRDSHWGTEVFLSGGLTFRWVVTGMGPKAARRGLQEAIHAYGPFRQVVGLGVAGGLTGRSQTGDLALPDRILFEDRLLKPTPRLVQELAQGISTPFWTFGMTGTELVQSSKDKMDLFEEHAAEFVDMESGAWGSVCQSNGIDWCVMRTVLDGPTEELPEVLSHLSDRYGRFRGFGAVGAMVRKAPQMWALARVMGRQMPCAMKHLRKALGPWIKTRLDRP